MAVANTTREGTATDVVYTPDKWATDIVRTFEPRGLCLEPCRGGGAFHRLLPEGSPWCEIAEGKDFFEWTDPVDWIVTNPPYSILDEFLAHSMAVSDNVVFLIPVAKLLASTKKLKKVYAWGGIKHIRYYGTGRQLGFPFGFPVGAIHLQRGYSGDMRITWHT